MTILHASLVSCIERVIKTPPRGFSSSVIPGREAEWPRSGVYFSLRNDLLPITLYPWFGVYDTALGPIIYIGFEDLPAHFIGAGLSFSRPYRDVLRGEWCFAMTREQVQAFQSGYNHDTRSVILAEFYNEVLTVLFQSMQLAPQPGGRASRTDA